MKFLTFLLLVILALVMAGAYGALHDQLSYTLAHEYFTRFKYHQFGVVHLDWPHRIKAAWIGFLATWWMGFPIAAIVGGLGWIHPTPRLMFRRTLRAYLIVVGTTILVGLAGLLYGSLVASSDPQTYQGWFIPDDLENPAAFLRVGHLHNFGYLGGLIGILTGAFAQFWLRKTNPSEKEA